MSTTIHSTAYARAVAATLLLASSMSLAACGGASADALRSDLRSQITEVGGLTADQTTCLTGLVDGLTDAEVERLAEASSSGDEPDVSDPAVADFTSRTQGCIVDAASIKELVLDGLPAELTIDQRSCMEDAIDGLDDAALTAVADGKSSELSDALLDCAVEL